MFFWTHRMPLSEPCRKFFPEVPFFLAWSPQLRRKWKSPEKNASWLFSRRLEIIYISPTANVFPKAHKSFAWIPKMMGKKTFPIKIVFSEHVPLKPWNALSKTVPKIILLWKTKLHFAQTLELLTKVFSLWTPILQC